MEFVDSLLQALVDTRQAVHRHLETIREQDQQMLRVQQELKETKDMLLACQQRRDQPVREEPPMLARHKPKLYGDNAPNDKPDNGDK